MMISVFLLCSVVAGKLSALGLIAQPPVQCSREGVSCTFNFSEAQCWDEGWVRPNKDSPGLPAVSVGVSSRPDESMEKVPVLLLSFALPADGSLYTLRGTEVHVLEVSTNHSLCVRYIFNKKWERVAAPDGKPIKSENKANCDIISCRNPSPNSGLRISPQWSFTLDRITVRPGLKYRVSVSNLPKPDVGTRADVRQIPVVGCGDPVMGRLRVCLENGSLWDPNLTWSVSEVQGKVKEMRVSFNTARFSELYRVRLTHPDFTTQITVLKDNHTSVNATFLLDAEQLKQCELVIVIKPFFVGCMNNCSEYQQKFRICSGSFSPRHHMFWTVLGLAALMLCIFKAALLHSNSIEDLYTSSSDTTDKKEEDSVPVQMPSKVLIIYSLDHPLYKEIVLKLCAFLRAKCGTDVMLDLLDFTQLSTVGSIQWLEMQRERLAGSSDKVLILCSPGVNAKWRGMCGGSRVRTREDSRSPMGDLLTPALSLIVPDFVHASTYGKYMVAYFGDICNEKDIPAPFNVTVKYQLMKHFEELFFRLLDKEKHEPGSIKQVEGIGRDDYFNSVPGRALKDAIEAFQAYQLENPNWFQMELVDEEVEENGHKQNEDADFTWNCVLQNQLWVRDVTHPALIHNPTGQTNDWNHGLTEITNMFEEPC